MKRKAMEIDKSKIERARDGKGSAGNFVPSGGISSGGMGGGGRGGGLVLDSAPSYSRCGARTRARLQTPRPHAHATRRKQQAADLFHFGVSRVRVGGPACAMHC